MRATQGRVQVIGERNSATNYVIELIEGNFDLEMARGVNPARLSMAVQKLPWGVRERVRDTWFLATGDIWKHALLDESAMRRLEHRNTHVVAVVKHPLSWAISTHRRPYHRVESHGDLVDFVSTPWKTIGRERMGRRTMANCFELWAAKAEAVEALAAAGRIERWRFEDVLVDEQGHLRRLAERLGVPAPAELSRVPENTKSQHGITQTHAEIRDHYVGEAWRADVPEPMRELAIATCGDIAGRMGYEI